MGADAIPTPVANTVSSHRSSHQPGADDVERERQGELTQPADRLQVYPVTVIAQQVAAAGEPADDKREQRSATRARTVWGVGPADRVPAYPICTLTGAARDRGWPTGFRTLPAGPVQGAAAGRQEDEDRHRRDHVLQEADVVPG